MEFAKKLRALRTEKGLSQEKLAAAIHISRSAVAKWENGLGLPSEESLKVLAEYFEVSVVDLISNKVSEETLVSKNITIALQKKVIMGLLIGALIGIFILGYIFIEPLRQMMGLMGLGAILMVLGIYNMMGNIASIHWYQRRKVTKENQRAYCLFIGLGTLIIGVGLIVTGIVRTFWLESAGDTVTIIGVIVGLILMLYAQFKYNKGLF